MSFDDNTLVGCMLHDANYTIEDSQDITQDKQKKSNVSQDPEEELSIVWDFTIKHYKTHPREEHISEPSMEKQVVASLIPEKPADASATPTQKESNSLHKASHNVREPQTMVTNVSKQHKTYIKKLQLVTEDEWVLYNTKSSLVTGCNFLT